MSAVFTLRPAGSIRFRLPGDGLSGLRLAAVLGIAFAFANPAQAQFGDLSPEPQDNFGGALARGDFNNDGFQDLAIGIPYEGIRSAAPGPWPQINSAGAVEVIYGSTTGLRSSGRQFWRQGSNGIGDVPEAGDNFGWSLAVGDFNGDSFADLAIGVPGEDVDGYTNAGAVHVLYGSLQGLSTSAVTPQFWHQGSPGVKERREAGDFFGWSLAAGDFNLDGYADLVVGVPFETLQTVRAAGAVNVLFGTALGLTAELPDDQLWTRDDPILTYFFGGASTNARFGYCLAAADFNGDGFVDLAVGAPGDSPSGALPDDMGAVNVIYGSASGLSTTTVHPWLLYQTTANSDGPEPYDAFGFALAAGDFNGDGFADLAVGVPGDELGGIPGAGAVSVFYGSAHGFRPLSAWQSWDQDSPGVEGGVEPDDQFGLVLTAGDFNNDGYDDLAIGVPFEAIGSLAMAGAVNVIYGSHSSGLSPFVVLDQIWHQNSPGMPSTAAGGDGFGYALIAGDFNGDGRVDLAIGVPGEDVNGASNSGAVNVIHGAPDGLNTTYVPVQTWSQQFVLPPNP